MGQLNETELRAMGYEQKFDYSQFSHDNDINVIPKKDFKRLIRDTFKTITTVVKETYGPYGSTYTLNELNQTSSTKDGYNSFEAIHFSHQYKQMVKLTIGKICSRVNEVVGDGTTSCLLLADKIFDSIDETLKTPEDERLINDILTDVQKFFNDSLAFATDYDYIKPLNHESLESVLMMASNHDKKLRDTLIDALDVKYDSDGSVTSINNINVQTRIDQSVSTKYEILKMPGDYRIEVGMFPNDIALLLEKQNVVIIAYDHNFSEADFTSFITTYKDKYCLNNKAHKILNTDGTLSDESGANEIPRPIVLLCATNFNQRVIDDYMTAFLKGEAIYNRSHNIIPVTVKGVYARNEIRDLAAVAGIPCHTVYTPTIKFEDFDKFTTVTVFNNDCLCMYDVKPPANYIEALNIDMKNEETSSRRIQMKKRIDALMMTKSDTTINLTVPNSLEQKMLEDKIDDCVSIIESAFEHGCVPNLFKFAHTILKMYKTIDDRTATVIDSIIKSIEGIFTDVWISKYGDDENLITERTNRMTSFYESYDVSYDIINDEFIPLEKLSTSVQYDVEVVCATLEIVKFLLTSRGLIFDSCLLQMHGDNGRYVPT